MNDRARTKGRMAIYAMAGFYLAFQAYEMFRNLDTSSGNEKILMIVFMILFAIVGVGMMVMGVVTGYKLSKQDYDAGKNEGELEKTEENALEEKETEENQNNQ